MHVFPYVGSACISAHVLIYARLYMYMIMHTLTYMRIHIHTYACTWFSNCGCFPCEFFPLNYIHTHIHTWSTSHTHTYIHTNKHIYIHIHAHTHTHTCTWFCSCGCFLCEFFLLNLIYTWWTQKHGIHLCLSQTIILKGNFFVCIHACMHVRTYDGLRIMTLIFAYPTSPP
jgi:hypothetical protein